jgi:hypothetical protein
MRRALAKKPAQCARRKRAENKVSKVGHNRRAVGTKKVEGPLTHQEMLNFLAADQRVCLGIARALLHNEQWAEEILSDCALSATAQIGAGKVRADTAARFHAWLHKVIRFSCYRFLKRQKPELEWNETTANKQIDKFGDEDCQVIGVSKKCPSADDQ